MADYVTFIKIHFQLRAHPLNVFNKDKYVRVRFQVELSQQ